MGYVAAFAPCVGCGNLFSFNPVKVPSISIDGGPKQPICAGCVARVNPMREKNGLPIIVPLDGAYDAAEAEELE